MTLSDKIIVVIGLHVFAGINQKERVAYDNIGERMPCG